MKKNKKRKRFNINKYKKNTKENFLLYNEKIPQGEYLVLDENGDKLGILNQSEILKLSEEKETDIVLINSSSNPRVVRLMNFSKFKYRQKKKIKEIKKKQQIINTKEIRVNPNIENNDLNIKIKRAVVFLNKGNKVKFIVRFKGRMINNTILGEEIFKKIQNHLVEISILETNPKMEGNRMIALFIPKKR
ncbi:translation initiation factor IF-3 [Candidatus Phytoplasma sacchari]